MGSLREGLGLGGPKGKNERRRGCVGSDADRGGVMGRERTRGVARQRHGGGGTSLAALSGRRYRHKTDGAAGTDGAVPLQERGTVVQAVSRRSVLLIERAPSTDIARAAVVECTTV